MEWHCLHWWIRIDGSMLVLTLKPTVATSQVHRPVEVHSRVSPYRGLVMARRVARVGARGVLHCDQAGGEAAGSLQRQDAAAGSASARARPGGRETSSVRAVHGCPKSPTWRCPRGRPRAHHTVHPTAVDRPLTQHLKSQLDEVRRPGRGVVDHDAHIFQALDRHRLTVATRQLSFSGASYLRWCRQPAAVRFGQAEAFQDLERRSNQNAESLQCPSLRRVLVRATGMIRRAPPFKRQIASSQTARTELLTLWCPKSTIRRRGDSFWPEAREQ